MTRQIESPGAQIEACHDSVTPTEFVLGDGSYTIGRSTTCSVVIAQGQVSRIHARIEYDHENKRYKLTDNVSEHGTYVNGHQIGHAPYTLKMGDQIGLGTKAPKLRFVDPDATEQKVSKHKLSFDISRQVFAVDNNQLDLTRLEFKFLLYLQQNLGILCSFEDCVYQVWKTNDKSKFRRLNELKIGIHKKIHAFTGDDEAEYIKLRTGMGFILSLEPEFSNKS